VTLTWDAAEKRAWLRFVVLYRPLGADDVTDWQRVVTSDHEATLSPLQRDVQYEAVVLAADAFGVSAASRPVYFWDDSGL